ncbi:MAG: UvrB/UvrC motif-containing protein [candidate division Zixibacteria bacterium]|nr:UvrB/UvrC motif-containing protein [candidate division Zixibacteria bacterium]
MVCQDCGKREATVHLTQVINNKKVELKLCQECAEKRGFRNPLEGVPFPLAEFLASMLSQTQREKPSKEPEAVCSACGMSFSDFSKTGRLGCGNCYLTFRSQLNDLLRKVHGSTQHRGKFPHTTRDVMKPLWEETKLHEELRKAIQEEDFERAAQIRDRIKALAAKK